MNGKVLFFTLLLILVALEAISAVLAYETWGEVISLYYWPLLALNVAFALLAFRHLRVATVGAVLLALAIVPYQFWLGYRLWLLQNEAAAVVVHVYEQKLTTGEYPSSLAQYSFQRQQLASHFQYERETAECEFRVSYYVGTPNTSHSYCPAHGWSYYPD